MNPPDKELLSSLRIQAMQVSKNAYSPYSRFQVGAVVLDREGRLFKGCNMENASFSLTQCAERNAIAAALSNGASAGSLTTLVIYKSGERALPPCGACRQVMHEMMARDSQVISCCDSTDVKIWSRDDYLPDAFEYRNHPFDSDE